MKNENKKEILKVMKGNKESRNVAIIAIVTAIFVVAIGVIINSRPLPTPVEISSATKEDEYAYGKVFAFVLFTCFLW